MSSSAKISVNIARLLRTLNLEIRVVPDDLKCVECKSVLKEAYQVPCGCRFCRTCIDDMMARGIEFCPGGSQECDETPLLIGLPDYRANKSISRLIAKCPQKMCTHECPLADMEGHLRMCERKSVECQQDESVDEEMSGHLQQENQGHNKILIGMVTNINKEIEMLKRELARKGEQISTIMDAMRDMQNENKTIKQEKESLHNRVRELSEKLEGGIPGASASNIRSISQEIQSTKGDIDSLKSQLQSTQIDASCDEWLIDEDIGQAEWGRIAPKTSECFTGTTRPYLYKLASANMVERDQLLIRLLILPGSSNSSLTWPFDGRVTVIVADRNKPQACSRLTQQCSIDKPRDNNWTWSENFLFRHSELKATGLDLSRGVLVSCQIVPGAAW